MKKKLFNFFILLINFFRKFEAQHDSSSIKESSNNADIWGRIGKMVDSGAKTSRSTKDISRMKSMILNYREFF